jgi:UDP-N-acetylglucosamine--N-acetylmuramyl-(pentapeptide) pyrophosphoryl-undecaprenol N-acetylglucosamine transferase
VRGQGTRGVFAVVAGGGTAGHVLPALAVARALADRGRGRRAVRFLGARRGVDKGLLEGAGFEFVLLPGRGLARRATLANAGALVGLAWALVRSTSLLLRWRPAVVVSLGGYAGVAPAVAAKVLRVPVVLVCIDAVPGAASRLVSRLAAASAVAFPGTGLPRATVTGAPLRSDLTAAAGDPGARARARASLGVPDDRLLVAVVGGSLGARRLNEATIGLVERLCHRGDVAVRHVTGRRDLPELLPRVEAAGGALVAPGGSRKRPQRGRIHYEVVEYETAMAELLLAADLVVSRAGAMTLAELAALGRPAVLVPLPGAPADHQRRNAEAMARAGAAVVLADEDCTPARLAAVVTRLLDDPRRRAEMGAAAARLARLDATERVAELVERCARVEGAPLGSEREPVGARGEARA